MNFATEFREALGIPKPITTTWQTVSPGIQQRFDWAGNLRYRVRFRQRVYPCISASEACDLLALLRKHDRYGRSLDGVTRRVIHLT